MEEVNLLANKLLGYLNSAEIFLKDQMPDFVIQFVAYETWKTQWMFQISLIILVFLILLQLYTIIYSIVKEVDMNIYLVAFMGVGFIGTICLWVCIDSYLDLKQLEIAPKVYIVNAAKKLVTK